MFYIVQKLKVSFSFKSLSLDFDLITPTVLLLAHIMPLFHVLFLSRNFKTFPPHCNQVMLCYCMPSPTLPCLPLSVECTVRYSHTHAQKRGGWCNFQHYCQNDKCNSQLTTWPKLSGGELFQFVQRLSCDIFFRR